MKKTIAALMLAPSVAFASSHREAPSISFDPAADNTDVYAWMQAGTHDKLYVVANYIPLEEPSGGPNFHTFSDDVLYEVHLSRGDSLDDAITYQIRFATNAAPRVDPADLNAPLGGGKEFFAQLSGRAQTYTVTKVVGGTATTIGSNLPVAPTNIGPRTDAVVYGQAYDDAFAATFVKPMGVGGDEGRVFAGPRDDGFYVDLGGVFDLANLRAKGAAQDGVSGYNTHSIVLEIPTGKLTADGQIPTVSSNDSTLGVWASASRPKITILKKNGAREHSGPFVQVSRLGLPLINEVMIGIQDKDKFNATHPKNDVTNFGAYLLNPVIVRDAEAVGIYTALGVDPTAAGLKSNRTDILDVISLKDANHSFTKIGDVLRVDMALDSQFPNGRSIPGGASNTEQVDVTDVLMTVVLAKGTIALGDAVDYNDKDFLAEMPFLPLPHRGYDEGHGKPTP